MARIPMGDFGQLVPKSTPTPTATAAQLDGGLSQATMRIGNTAINIASQRIDELEQQRKHAQQLAEQEVRKAADLQDRLTSGTAIASLRNDAKSLTEELRQDIALGNISPNDTGQEFDKRAAKLVSSRVEGLRPDLAAQVKMGTLDEIGNARLQALGVATAQTRSLAKGELMNLGEQLQRAALTDRPRAIELFKATLEQSGPAAGMAPDEMQREMISFREKTARAMADQLVNGARDDQASLDAVQQRLAGPEFDDLAPEQRGPMEARILARKQFLENQRTQQIVRAEAQFDRRERAAERAISEAEKMVDLGQMPNAETMKQFADKVAGTSYAPRLQAMVAQSAERAGFAQLSPDQQRAKLMDLRAKATTEGSSPELQARIARFEQIRNTTESSLNEDALMHGARAGLVTLQPLEMNLTTLGTQLAVRGQAAETVAARVKRDVSPLTKDEAVQIGSLIGNLGAPQRESAVRDLARSMTPAQAQALAKQINDRDPALGLAMFQASANPSGAALPLILRGQDAKKAGRIKDDAQSNNEARTIAKQMEEINWGTPAARDYAAQTAAAILDGMRDRGSASVREAVKLATGGIGQWADSKVPLPPGMDDRTFERRLDGMRQDPAKLASAMGVQIGVQQVSVGGSPMTVDQLARQFGRVNLISAGPGRYALEAGGQMVIGPNGRPVRIDLRK